MNVMLPMPKRLLRRSRLYLKARVQDTSGHFDVLVRDISSAGALVESATPPAVSSVVQLVSGDTVMDAHVVWVDGQWFGIEFDQPLSGELLEHKDATLKVAAPRGYRREEPEIENDDATGSTEVARFV